MFISVFQNTIEPHIKIKNITNRRVALMADMFCLGLSMLHWQDTVLIALEAYP